MRTRLWLKIASGCAVTAAVLIACTISPHTRVNAQSAAPNGDSRIQIGLAAAPVPLNLTGKNPALVGLGSYYVNVVGDCNGCHSAGPPTEFGAPGVGAGKKSRRFGLERTRPKETSRNCAGYALSSETALPVGSSKAT